MSTDPAFNTFLATVRVALLTAGGALATDGVISQGVLAQIQLYAGAGVIVGTAAWSIWNAWVNFRRARAQGVAAGISLTLSGKAVTEAGDVISAIGTQEATPPKMPTLKTADQIMKEFAPPASAIKKA
jgi:hypothetical protein